MTPSEVEEIINELHRAAEILDGARREFSDLEFGELEGKELYRRSRARKNILAQIAVAEGKIRQALEPTDRLEFS